MSNMKLYDIEKGSKIYIDTRVFIFDHLDGMFSYCYNEDDETYVIHLAGDTPLVEYEDGYKIEP